MLIPNTTIQSAAGGDTVLSDTTLGADSATMDFTGISQAYAHLRLLITAQTNRTGTPFDPIQARFNNDSGSNYYGYSTLTGDKRGQTSIPISAATCPSGGATAGFLGQSTMILPFYTGSAYKTGVGNYGFSVSSGTAGNSGTIWLEWISTAAINRITLVAENFGTNLLLAGSRLIIYGQPT